MRLRNYLLTKTLEAACEHALPRLSSPRYRHLKAILESRLDEPRGHSGKRPPEGGARGHLRGADYYRD